LELLPDALGPRDGRPLAIVGIAGSMLVMAALALLLGA